VLSFEPPSDFEASWSVLGRARIEPGARIQESAVWDGVSIGRGARLSGCLAAGGAIEPGAAHEGVLLWGTPGEPAASFPI
jgi:hypothetical protein